MTGGLHMTEAPTSPVDHGAARDQQGEAGGGRQAHDRDRGADLSRRPRPPSMKGSRRRFGARERFMLVLILPAFAILVAFQIVPILIGANASFRSWSLFDPQKTFVGLANYRRILADPILYGTVLPNTLVFMVGSVTGGLVAGLGLATMLNRKVFCG